MVDDISTFAQIAPYLTHPLVLVGFVLVLVFGIHKKLLKAGIIPQLDQQDGSRLVRLLVHYGFWLGVLIILAGKTEEKSYYEMSLELFKQVGSPNAKNAQAGLNSLEQPSSSN